MPQVHIFPNKVEYINNESIYTAASFAMGLVREYNMPVIIVCCGKRIGVTPGDVNLISAEGRIINMYSHLATTCKNRR